MSQNLKLNNEESFTPEASDYWLNHFSDRVESLVASKKITLVQEVTFSGEKYWELKSDDNTKIYNGPHWVDRNGDLKTLALDEPNSPVAFTRNTKPKIEAKFKTSLADGTKVWVRAQGKDGVGIRAVALTVKEGMIALPATESTSAFPDKVGFYHKDSTGAFVLNWEVSIDGGKTYENAGKTKHTVYITLADPKTEYRQESLFFISTRNAQGATSEKEIIEKTFQEFADLKVARVGKEEAMGYWSGECRYTVPDATEVKPKPLDCYKTESLLATGVGRCAAWASFLKSALEVHGVSEVKLESITSKTSNGGFLIKNWNFNENLQRPVEAEGMAGQGNENPHSAFYSHVVVTHQGKIYDPSYGKSYDSLEAWENNSIDFFVSRHEGGRIKEAQANTVGKIETQMNLYPAPRF